MVVLQSSDMVEAMKGRNRETEEVALNSPQGGRLEALGPQISFLSPLLRDANLPLSDAQSDLA